MSMMNRLKILQKEPEEPKIQKGLLAMMSFNPSFSGPSRATASSPWQRKTGAIKYTVGVESEIFLGTVTHIIPAA